MDDLKGKTAVVTGAASGIGRAVATELHAAGMRIVMGDIDADGVVAAAAAIGSADRVVAIGLDVRDPGSVEAAAEVALERFGALHVAVNNAGVVNGGPVWELEPDEWHEVLDVNLWGVIHGIRSFVPRILDSGEPGHVVNICSTASLLAMESLGPYTVAKHGVLGLTEVLRLDLRRVEAPVGVTAVFPGLVRTGMSPIGEDPSVAAERIVDGIRRDRPHVFTDQHFGVEVQAQLQKILTARRETMP
jgi:NAD(P)-dependent dehydrogenase (short-subunit alcohol dehydrogenase family)